MGRNGEDPTSTEGNEENSAFVHFVPFCERWRSLPFSGKHGKDGFHSVPNIPGRSEEEIRDAVERVSTGSMVRMQDVEIV